MADRFQQDVRAQGGGLGRARHRPARPSGRKTRKNQPLPLPLPPSQCIASRAAGGGGATGTQPPVHRWCGLEAQQRPVPTGERRCTRPAPPRLPRQQTGKKEARRCQPAPPRPPATHFRRQAAQAPCPHHPNLTFPRHSSTTPAPPLEQRLADRPAGPSAARACGGRGGGGGGSGGRRHVRDRASCLADRPHPTPPPAGQHGARGRGWHAAARVATGGGLPPHGRKRAPPAHNTTWACGHPTDARDPGCPRGGRGVREGGGGGGGGMGGVGAARPRTVHAAAGASAGGDRLRRGEEHARRGGWGGGGGGTGRTAAGRDPLGGCGSRRPSQPRRAGPPLARRLARVGVWCGVARGGGAGGSGPASVRNRGQDASCEENRRVGRSRSFQIEIYCSPLSSSSVKGCWWRCRQAGARPATVLAVNSQSNRVLASTRPVDRRWQHAGRSTTNGDPLDTTLSRKAKLSRGWCQHHTEVPLVHPQASTAIGRVIRVSWIAPMEGVPCGCSFSSVDCGAKSVNWGVDPSLG